MLRMPMRNNEAATQTMVRIFHDLTAAARRIMMNIKRNIITGRAGIWMRLPVVIPAVRKKSNGIRGLGIVFFKWIYFLNYYSTNYSGCLGIEGLKVEGKTT